MCSQGCSLLENAEVCDAVELTLELGEKKARTNTRYTLWYQLGLKNKSCDLLTLDLYFLKGDWTGTTLEIKVWGPDGERVYPQVPLPYEKSIEVYVFDEKSNSEHSGVLVKTDSFGGRSAIFQVSPGDALLSTPSLFRPRELRPHDGPSIEQEFPGSANQGLRAGLRKQRDERIQKALESFKLREPMPGYRILEGFVFQHPGKYQIQAEFKDKAFVSRSASWDQNLVIPLDLIANKILIYHGRIPGAGFKEVDISDSSQILEFEVAP